MKNSEIKIEAIEFAIDGVAVLGPLSANFIEKRISIIGRNGSGKSTLARLMSGLITPTRGQVHINDIDIAKDRKAALKTVGIMFQNPDHQIIFPTVGEEIAFGLRQLGYSKSDVEDKLRAILEQFAKQDWYNRNVMTFSQGQRQLICLMSVLAMEPKVLILDEPFSGLDIPTTRALREILDNLDQTIIHITHDPAVATNADRVIWIDEGLIVKDGHPSDVLAPFMAAMEQVNVL